MQALEKQTLVVSESLKVGTGRPTTVWSAREIPGVWSVGLVSLHSPYVSIMSTMSQTPSTQVSDIIDVVDEPGVSPSAAQVDNFTQEVLDDIF